MTDINKIVWVFGCSASGKETFINMVCSGECNIINDLGWQNEKVIKIEESINYIKQYDNDPIGDKRIEIINKVIEENKNNQNAIIYDCRYNYIICNEIPKKIRPYYNGYLNNNVFLINNYRFV